MNGFGAGNDEVPPAGKYVFDPDFVNEFGDKGVGDDDGVLGDDAVQHPMGLLELADDGFLEQTVVV